MDRRKGFTLIELLAVIVVLAIIALIATPIVLNLINNARVGAAEQSATGYVKAVENTIMKDMLNDNAISDGKYKYNYLNVDINGNMPTEGNYNVKDGKIESAKLCINGYAIEYKDGKSKKISNVCDFDEYKVYENGTAIYFNPETMTTCDESESVNKTGTKEGCMKWYTYNDDGKKASTVNMILEHNTTPTVAWNSTGSNKEMKEVKETLESDTSTWNSTLNARLITAEEVARITGNTSWSVCVNKYFYLDSNNQTQTANDTNKSKYAWLYDYTSCKGKGCNINSSSTSGYWTSTACLEHSARAWRVNGSGQLSDQGSIDYSVVAAKIFYGVRPVITVSKEIIG